MRLTAMPQGWSLVRAVLIAGAVAGLVLGAFHLVVSEPFVDRAIAIEEAAHERELAATGATAEHHEEVFSRRTQKAGLLVGTLVSSLAAGAVFAGAFALLPPQLPGHTRRAQVALLAGAAAITVVLVPFLKYPANPPGVGDPGTLASRQLLYVGCVLLSVAGLGVSAQFFGWLRQRTSTGAAAGGAMLLFAVWAGAVLIALPARTDPVNTPDRLLGQFRAASLLGQLLYWTLFSGLFAIVLERGEQSPAVARSPHEQPAPLKTSGDKVGRRVRR